MIYFYKKQGVTIFPGAWRPLIGNLPELANYETVSKQSDEPLIFPWSWLLQYYFDAEDPTTCLYENHKAVVYNAFGKPIINIISAECVQDIFITKN